MRRAKERVLADRIMWLAVASPNSQVRAIASLNPDEARARLRTAVAKTELDTAQQTLMAADIKRFLERPLDSQRPIPLPAPDAPPGAQIDSDQDWLAPPPAYGGSHPFSFEYLC